jgi:E3 ubiquitin-protein ligase HECTD3
MEVIEFQAKKVISNPTSPNAAVSKCDLPNHGYIFVFFFSFPDVIEFQYSLHKSHKDQVAEMDTAAVKRLQIPPQNWSTDCDTELVRFLSELTEPENDNLGSIKNYVESIDVSSFCVSGYFSL